MLRQEVEKSREDHMLLASQLQMDAALQTPVRFHAMPSNSPANMMHTE